MRPASRRRRFERAATWALGCALGALFALHAQVAAAGAPSAAAVRAERIAQLAALPNGWAPLALGADAAVGVADARAAAAPPSVPIGQSWQLRVRTAHDAHLCALLLDGHGVLSVLTRDAAAPTPATRGAWRARSTQIATPPIGEWDVFVIATRTPLAANELLPTGGARVIAPAEAEAFLRAAARTLAERGAENVAISHARLQIAGRAGLRGTRIVADDAAGDLEYASDDIVDYFTSQRAHVVGSVRLDLHVRFEPDSAALDEAARASLDIVGRALLDARLLAASFRIGGHTDDVGSEPYNLALSQRRADAVLAYLADEWGIAAQRLEVVPYGESSPLEAGDSAAARAFNRRVDFELSAAPRASALTREIGAE